MFGGKLEALLAVYGMNSPHCDFWVALDGDGLPAGGVGREGDTLTLALSQSVDTEELTQFLAAVGGQLGGGAGSRPLLPCGKMRLCPAQRPAAGIPGAFASLGSPGG